MNVMAMAMLAFVLTSCFMSTADSAPCPPDTVQISIISAVDVRNLTDSLACEGQGIFNITWHSNVTIDERFVVSDGKHVTVTADAFHEDNAAGVIIDAGSGTGVFSVSDGSTLRLSNIGLEGGDAEDGGAIAVFSSSVLVVHGCTFARNNASYGGALFASDSSVYVDGSTSFEENTALYGGAIYVDGSDMFIDGRTSFGHNSAEGSSVEIVSSYVSAGRNTIFQFIPATSSGGAIFANDSVVNIDGDTSFAANLAYFQGGAIYAENSTIRVDGKTNFSNNFARGATLTKYFSSSLEGLGTVAAADGGAICAQTSNVSIDGDVTFTNNSATDDGGVIHADSSYIGIDGYARFTINSAGNDGGAIYAQTSDVGIDGDVTFTNNSATNSGGAASAYTSNFSMDGHAHFASNKAGGFGGAFNLVSSAIYLNGITNFDNNVASYGGAVRSTSSSILVGGTTNVYRNSAQSGGAVFMDEASKFVMDGSAAFYGNSAESVEGEGGAVHAVWSEVYMNGATEFINNGGGPHGGAVYGRGSDIYMDGITKFVNNSASFLGGAVYTSGSNVSMDGTTDFANNSCKNGGAMATYGSKIDIVGSTTFTHNTATVDGGAIHGQACEFAISPGRIFVGSLYGDEVGSNAEVAAGHDLATGVAFIENSASGLGGAMFFEDADLLQVNLATFKSNEAVLGGAAYIVAVEDKTTEFSACNFDGNEANDGGAIYFNTGSGVDIITASYFRGNTAQFSGGAIFHIGPLRMANTSFVANQAGIEGVAVISIGLLEALSNVSFSENLFYCRAGSYGYVIKDDSEVCASCFNEVCARCSSGYGDSAIVNGVRTDGLPVCEETPTGATALSSGTTVATLTLEEGYYRTSNQSRVVLKCFHASACIGGSGAEGYCAAGYKGPYCAVCDDGFAQGIAHSCRECSGGLRQSAVGLGIAVGLAVLLVAGLLFSNLGSVIHTATGDGVGEARSIWRQKLWSCQSCFVQMLPLAAIKIVVTVWQIISQFDAIAGDVYPEFYEKFIAKLSPINLEVDFVFSYSCIVSTDFYHRLLVATIAPGLVLVVLAGSYILALKRNSHSDRAMRLVRHKHQSVVLYLAFFVYSPVSYKIFQTFSCDKLDDGNSYLRVDYSLSCLTPRHSWYEAYALVMVGVYPVGIVCLFVWLLGRYRHDLVKPNRETMAHLAPLRGIWAAYKRSRYYFEVVECCRRLALTAIAAFVLPSSTAQVAIVLLFAVIFVFISEAISPFQKPADMNLYRWGNGIIVASMYVAFLMKIDVGHDSANVFLTYSGVLIAANMFMVVTVLLQTALLVKEWRMASRTVRMVDVPARRTN